MPDVPSRIPPTAQYTTADIARITGRTQRSIILDCRSGVLKARQARPNSTWWVSAESLRDYLGVRPNTPLPPAADRATVAPLPTTDASNDVRPGQPTVDTTNLEHGAQP